MKKVIYFLSLLCLSFDVSAFLCEDQTGDTYRQGTANIDNVPVDSSIFSTPDRVNIFAEVDQFMWCWNEAPSSYVDYLYLRASEVGPKFSSVSILKTGVILNGMPLENPVSGDYLVFRLAEKTQPLGLQLYLQVAKIPGPQLLVAKGDLLMTLYLHKFATNPDNDIEENGFDHFDFIWKFYAGEDVILGTGTCDINNNSILEVDFQTVSAGGISTNSGMEGRYQIPLVLTYQCEDTSINETIRMTLQADSSYFSNDAMLVRQGEVVGSGSVMPGLGVEVYHEGNLISANRGTFLSQLTNGLGQDTLVFTLLKKSNLGQNDLVEGFFNSSGTIIMSTP